MIYKALKPGKFAITTLRASYRESPIGASRMLVK